MFVFLFTGISPDEIVKVSAKYNEKQEKLSSKQKGNKVRKFLFLVFL